MNAKRKYSLTTLLISAMVMILLVGCSDQKSSSTPKAKTPTLEITNSEYPIVIKHAFGETVIERKPERVATVAWANHDVALALGVVPVGFSAANYGVQDDSGLLPWTAEKLKELGEENQIFSRILTDLILKQFQIQTQM